LNEVAIKGIGNVVNVREKINSIRPPTVDTIQQQAKQKLKLKPELKRPYTEGRAKRPEMLSYQTNMLLNWN